MDIPEPPDGTRIEFTHDTDVYAAWRSDASSAAAGWTSGDGGEVWCLYGETVPKTWRDMVAVFGSSLRDAVLLVPRFDPPGVEHREVFSTWYRSITPDQKTWCESSNAREVVERSAGKDCTFESFTKVLVSNGWQPWTLESQLRDDAADETALWMLRLIAAIYLPDEP